MHVEKQLSPALSVSVMGLKDNWKKVAGLIARQSMVDGTEGAGTGESIAIIIVKLLHFESKDNIKCRFSGSGSASHYLHMYY